LVLWVFYRFFVIEHLLKLQLFVFSLVNYLFVPLMNRYPVSVDRFDNLNRSLVNLRCEFEFLIFPEYILNLHLLKFLLFKHLFIEKPLYHRFNLLGVELPQLATR
jgi:hypothetical protein